MYWLRVLGNVLATYVWKITGCVSLETYRLHMLVSVLATKLGNVFAEYAWTEDAASRNVKLAVAKAV
jgi:hypothetical protein